MKQSTILIATTMIVAFTTARTLAESKPTRLSRTADISFIREANADTSESFLKATSRPTKQHLDDLRSKDVITLSVPFRHQAIKIDLHKTSALTVVNECEIIDGTTAGNTCSTQASFFVGAVPGDPGIKVFLGIAGNQVAGYAEMGDELEVLAATAQGFEPSPSPDAHRLPMPEEPICDFIDRDSDFSMASDFYQAQPTAAGTLPPAIHQFVKLNIDIEPSFIDEFPTTCDAWNYMTLLYGMIAEIYRRDLAIEVEVAGCRAWEITPPWINLNCCNLGTGAATCSCNTQLCETESGCDECVSGATGLLRWRDNLSKCASGLPRDHIYHLVERRTFSAIGSADRFGICKDTPCCVPLECCVEPDCPMSGFPSNFWTRLNGLASQDPMANLRDLVLTGHELGHVVGGNHFPNSILQLGGPSYPSPSQLRFDEFTQDEVRVHMADPERCCIDREPIAVGDYDLSGGPISEEDRLGCVMCAGHSFTAHGCDAVFGDSSIDTGQDGLSLCDCDTWWESLYPDPADAIDCNSNDIPDGCDVDAGTATDCNLNGILDDCAGEPDVDCDGDGTLDVCEVPNDITLDAEAEGSRYIRAEVGPCGGEFKCAIRAQSLAGVACNTFVQTDGLLGLEAVYQTPGEWGVVYIHGEEIVPSQSYTVSLHFENQNPSWPTIIELATTWLFGDVDNDNDADDDDIYAAFDAFGGIYPPPPTDVSFYSVNVDPCEPSPGMQIQTADILEVIRAKNGGAYTDECTIPNCNP